mgnify:FL=1|tara:strand:- start:2678 stop:3952 length:1275 start_codon:yes stop_codon:yes gene_type:complete
MLKEIKHINLLKLETQNSNGSTFVFPKNTLEVSKLLKLCNKRKIEVVPIGGNTNRVKGTFQIDKTKSILMSLKHMNKIKTIDEDNLIMTVEAGVTLEKVQKRSLGKGFLFPVHVASHKECNIGGNISTNVGGLQVLKYGNIENNINGLEIVLMDGTIINQLSILKKDNFGPKIWKLFCGSEGTYGIITQANLKLLPKKNYTYTYLIEISKFTTLFKLFKQLRSKYFDQLTSYEVIFPEPVSILNQKNTKKFNVIVEFNSNENKNHNKDFEKFRVIKFEKNNIQSQIWPLRTKIVTQQVENSYLYKFDISLPLNNWSIFLNATKIFHKNNASYEPYFFGHLGDGNLHCNYKINHSNKSKYLKLEKFIYQLVIRLGGSIAAEHGLGYSKNTLIKKYKSKEHFEILTKIKSLFDKERLLNRDKLIKS